MQTRTLAPVLIGVAAATLPAPSAAIDEIVYRRGWAQVDYTESGGCRAEVRGNGQFYRIAGAGFRPGEDVRFHLVNDAVERVNNTIRPVEYRIVADGDGAWRQFYIPFVPHRSGGHVAVALDSASCSLDLAFDWRRRRP